MVLRCSQLARLSSIHCFRLKFLRWGNIEPPLYFVRSIGPPAKGNQEEGSCQIRAPSHRMRRIPRKKEASVDGNQPVKADDIIREIKRAGVRFVVALPDRTTSERLLKPILRDSDLKVVQVCKEDEGVSICSAPYCTGHQALLLIQYTGLLDSINCLRGAAVEGQNPVCMMVGLLGKEPGVAPTQSKRYGLRIVEPILDAMQIEH